MQWLVLRGEVLGELEYTGVDNFWIYGRFHPTVGFENYRAIFENLEAAFEEDSDDTLDLLEEINSWKLIVESENGSRQRITDFKINKGYFEFRLLLTT